MGKSEHATRAAESVPLTYITQQGGIVTCRTYFEFADTDQATVNRFDAAIADTDWTGYGQRLYDAALPLPPAPPASESLGAQGPVMTAHENAYTEFARAQIPGLLYLGEEMDASTPRLDAVLTTCGPGNE